MRRSFILIGIGLLLLLAPACALMSRSTHGMSFIIPLHHYDKAVGDVLKKSNAGELLPAALEKARKECEAEYAEVVRLADEWARREQFCRIPPEWFPRRMHLIPGSGIPTDKMVIYEEHSPADPKWPIQMLVYPLDEGGGQMISIHLEAIEGFARQPSQRLKHAYETLRATLAQRFGQQVHSSLD